MHTSAGVITMSSPAMLRSVLLLSVLYVAMGYVREAEAHQRILW
jgi:hypothetical protein